MAFCVHNRLSRGPGLISATIGTEHLLCARLYARYWGEIGGPEAITIACWEPGVRWQSRTHKGTRVIPGCYSARKETHRSNEGVSKDLSEETALKLRLQDKSCHSCGKQGLGDRNTRQSPETSQSLPSAGTAKGQQLPPAEGRRWSRRGHRGWMVPPSQSTAGKLDLVQSHGHRISCRRRGEENPCWTQ